MTRAPRALACLWLLLMLCAPQAQAQAVRAWLDRDQVALDETATLNIEVTGDAGATPDYAPLLRDFGLSGHSSSRRYEQVNGSSRVRTLYGVALQPLREGVLPVPSLAVGAHRSPALTLTVGAPAGVPAHAGDVVFIESEADAQSPWVQQAVGYVVRLYAGVPLVSGQLDQPEPEGATLQRVGDDVRYTREVGGRAYTVIERHYLLLPERSGTLEIPGARFRGRGITGFFDEFLGQGNDALQATGAPRRLQVRAIPDAAPQPWLPLRGLSLRWDTAPAQPRAGEATTVTLEATADGATAAQLPELRLPSIDGAQVFADPVQVDERFIDGRPQATARRSFSVVPARAGALRIEGPRLQWWDAQSGAARIASVPTLDWHVRPGQVPSPAAAGGGAASRAVPAPPVGGDAQGWHVPGILGTVRPWAFAAVLFAVAWLLTLAWGLHRRAPGALNGERNGERNGAPAGADAAGAPSLRRALQSGDLGDIADALCASARPPLRDLDAVLRELDAPAQRDAVADLQRARWSDGDPALARAALRGAFREGPQWREPRARTREPLPPLYPPG